MKLPTADFRAEQEVLADLYSKDKKAIRSLYHIKTCSLTKQVHTDSLPAEVHVI